jgi:hypothetical protein
MRQAQRPIDDLQMRMSEEQKRVHLLLLVQADRDRLQVLQ